jgi:alcohol dehydrogenase class IV
LDLIEWLRELHGSIGIRSLSRLGVTSSSFPEIITRTKLSSSIKGNPIVLSDEDLLKILEFAS